jgi:hypothetical protein
MVESTETAYRMEGVAFRLADGIICFSGLTIGRCRGYLRPQFGHNFVIIGGIADAFGNSIGFFIS